MDGVDFVDFFLDRERYLWVLAALSYGLGDTATTLWGVSARDVAEAGPVAGPVMNEYGAVSFLGVKIGTFLLFYGVWSVLRTPGRAAVPLALVVVGTFVTGWNLAVLLTG